MHTQCLPNTMHTYTYTYIIMYICIIYIYVFVIANPHPISRRNAQEPKASHPVAFIFAAKTSGLGLLATQSKILVHPQNLFPKCHKWMKVVSHYIPWHSITSRHITLHYIALHSVISHYIALHYLVLQPITFHLSSFAWQSFTLSWITLNFIPHCTTLHDIQSITLH